MRFNPFFLAALAMGEAKTPDPQQVAKVQEARDKAWEACRVREKATMDKAQEKQQRKNAKRLSEK